MPKSAAKQLTQTRTALTVAGFTLGNTGVTVRGKPSLKDWRAAKRFIDRCHSGSMWWLGDLLNFGEASYGDLAKGDQKAEGYGKQTAYQAKYVASSVPACIRIQNLSWEHHHIIAPLDEQSQRSWLQQAADNDWSVAELRKAIRKERIMQTLRDNPLPEGVFRVIYADPPWHYNDTRTAETKGGGRATGAAVAVYPTPTMQTQEICELVTGEKSVKDLGDTNSALFLWVTSPMTPDGLQVMEAWGYDYKGCFVWDKVRGFNGHYNDVRHELLLIGIRGSCQPRADTLRDSVQSVEKTTHSAKPGVFYEIIEELYPGPYVELFARKKRANWTAWGNEL